MDRSTTLETNAQGTLRLRNPAEGTVRFTDPRIAEQERVFTEQGILQGLLELSLVLQLRYVFASRENESKRMIQQLLVPTSMYFKPGSTVVHLRMPSMTIPRHPRRTLDLRDHYPLRQYCFFAVVQPDAMVAQETAQPRPQPCLSSSRGTPFYDFVVPLDVASSAPFTQWNTEKNAKNLPLMFHQVPF